MKRINKFIEKNIKLIISIFILMQPILDAIKGIAIKTFNKNIPLAPGIRCLFIFFCIYYIFFINREKKYIKKIIPLLIYTITYMTYIFIEKRQFISYEISAFLNTFYLPIILVGLLNIFEHKKIKIDLKLILITYFIYILLIIIPNITNTAYSSYEYAKVGKVGWYPLANVIGNLLSILLPLIIYFIINKKNTYLLKAAMIISILYVFASIGTKVPILALGICVLINFIYYFIKWIKEKQKTKITISITGTIIVTLLTLILIPKTSFYKNIQIHKEYLGITNYTEILTNYNLIDHFIFSQRLTFLKTIHNSNKDANLEAKLLGLGHVKKYNEEMRAKKVEIDYIDIIYENGIIGTITFFYIFLPALIEAIKKTKEKNLINLEYRISIILILTITFFAGYMLTSAAVSTYVALILTFINKGGLNEKAY